MSDDDPYDKVTAAFADASERLVEYADVWRSAIARNASGSYAADDLLVDLQALWGMSIRDAARVGAAVVESMAAAVPDPVDEPDDGDVEPDET